jgi:uncharacterized circularly permuted ATP-grasp superfamily protein
MRIWTLLFLVSCASVNRVPSQYDELRDSRGVRPEYRGILQSYNRLSRDERQRLVRLTTRDFGGDNPLLPLPRVLSGDEAFTLRRGVEQRADALRLFLKDYYSGRREYAKAGVFPEGFLQKVLQRSFDVGMMGELDPDQIAFFYGPDIIRDAQGQFRVIEDNPGFVGGLGDLQIAKEIYEKRFPEVIAQVPESPDPKRFYDDVMNRFRARAVPKDGKIVFLRYPHSFQADQEAKRLEQIMRGYGAETVVIPQPGRTYAKQLEVRSDGLYLKSGRGPAERVGFVVIEGEAFDVDPSFKGYELRFLVEEAQAHREDVVAGLYPMDDQEKWLQQLDGLIEQATSQPSTDTKQRLKRFLKQKSPILVSESKDYGIPGFWKLVHQGKVAASTAPGIDFLGDKEFYIFVEDLIRFYLREEPLIRNLETESLLGKVGRGRSVDESRLDELLKDRKKWVFKKVDGRGGSEVWVGPKISTKELKNLRELMLKEPEQFIVQQYTQLSQLDKYLVDLRLLTALDANGAVVSEIPWGRAKPISGNGKVNLSDGGAETLVLIRSRQLIQFKCNQAVGSFTRR